MKRVLEISDQGLIMKFAVVHNNRLKQQSACTPTRSDPVCFKTFMAAPNHRHADRYCAGTASLGVVQRLRAIPRHCILGSVLRARTMGAYYFHVRSRASRAGDAASTQQSRIERFLRLVPS